MTKTLLSILIALVFVFGAAGVTVAAAQQSQPGEPLYTLRTWSAQMLHQQDKMEISGQGGQTIQTQSRIHEPEIIQPQILEQAEHTIQTQSGNHEIEITQTPQSPAPLDICDQAGTNGQCGSDQHVGADYANDHPHRDHGNDRTNHQNGGPNHDNDSSEHQNSGTNQQNGGSNHENDGTNHENDGSDHEQNDH